MNNIYQPVIIFDAANKFGSGWPWRIDALPFIPYAECFFKPGAEWDGLDDGWSDNP